MASLPRALALLLVACGATGALATEVAPGKAPAADWVTRSNAEAALLLQVMARYNPEDASELGVDGYDEAISDYSRDQYAAQRADLQRVVAHYRQRLAGEGDARVRQDLGILIKAAEDSLSSQAVNRRYLMPFIDVTRFIYGVVQQTIDPRIPAARQQTLLVRLDKYTGVAHGFRPLAELARERTLERIHADGKLVGPFRGEVEQSLREQPTMLDGIRQLLAGSGLSGWESRYALLESQLKSYNDWLKAEMLPRARSDFRLPPEVYADNLHQYGVDMSPDELIARALTAFAEIRNQMVITAAQVAREQGFPDSDYLAVIRRLKQRQIPDDQLMPLYRQRLGVIEDTIRAQHIVTLPTRAAVIRLGSAAESAQQPAPHMNAPRLIGNTGEYGEFVLSTGLPPDASGKSLRFDDFSHQAASWTLTAHEARPGHELQFARMLEAGVSTARAVFAFNSVNVEGWALYSEAELQPYEPADGQLIALQMRGQRAARAFLDPMLNLGRVTPEAARRVLTDELGMSEAMAEQEIQRYTFRLPGQATSYFDGYQRLMEIRQAAQLAMGSRFDRLAFNDFVLDQGLLPPSLLRTAVLEDFVPPH